MPQDPIAFSNEGPSRNVEADDNDDDEQMDMDVNPVAQVPNEQPIDSMEVVNRHENDISWVDNTQVNNEPLNYDFPVEGDI